MSGDPFELKMISAKDALELSLRSRSPLADKQIAELLDIAQKRIMKAANLGLRFAHVMPEPWPGYPRDRDDGPWLDHGGLKDFFPENVMEAEDRLKLLGYEVSDGGYLHGNWAITW